MTLFYHVENLITSDKQAAEAEAKRLNTPYVTAWEGDAAPDEDTLNELSESFGSLEDAWGELGYTQKRVHLDCNFKILDGALTH